MGAEEPGDRELGMDRPITRRDFLHGVGAAVVAGALAPGAARAGSGDPGPGAPGADPPARSGLRGSQPGSFEVAHQLALEGRRDFGPVREVDAAGYDLVVVGAGISGLAAAWFQRRRHPEARILILDNHDDFGGHARRNEFRSGGRLLLGYGGSQSLEDPGSYSPGAKQLLRELGVDTSRFHQAYDRGFYRRHGLGLGVYFDRASYGVDRLVPMHLANPLDDQFAPPRLPRPEGVEQMPISAAAKRELLRVLEPTPGLFAGVAEVEDLAFLREQSYRDFVARTYGVESGEVWRLLNAAAVSGFADTIESVPAWDALTWVGLPGLPPALLEKIFAEAYQPEPYIFHFPDGNASIARLLVRSLIPTVAPGQTMEDVVTSRFDYARLDESDAPVRLRLESTAVRVEHDGPPAAARRVAVTYVRGGAAQRVWGRACILAGYNMMIPYLCPELPAGQRESLALLVKSPLVYSSVLLRDWQPWKRAGLGLAICPGSDHQVAMLDFPVSLGAYRFSGGPDEPIVAHLEGTPLESGSGLAPRQQYREARARLLATPFRSLERSIRTQLGGMLGANGFDPARDIEAITVNRWGHGYAWGYNPLVDPPYPDGVRPHELGRRRFGRIAIANSDAGANATLDTAIDQAQRAVEELAS